MAVQTVWSLGETPGGVLSVAKSVFLAATNDNVQPLAILACENFGNTIAMCLETCYKIEKSVIARPEMRSIQFLKAVAGFSSNDSTTQIGRSSAGVRFLALAAALVTTMGPFEGGRAIEYMLTETAAENTLLPTLKQLRDLLGVLEPRCHTSGFAESVVGWQDWLKFRLHSNDLFDIGNESQFPAPEALEKIIEAFRRLHRVGDASVCGVEIWASRCTSWLIAFTKWCTGMPPSVYFYDGSLILEQEGARIKLFMQARRGLHEDGPDLRVIVNYTVGSPTEFVVPGSGGEWNGMVSIASFGRFWLQERDLDVDLTRRAVVQALPFAISKALRNIRFSPQEPKEEEEFQNGGYYTQKRSPLEDELRRMCIRPTRSDRHVQKVISLFLSQKETAGPLPHLEDGVQILDLPLMKLYTDSLQCGCFSCTSIGHAGSQPCEKDSFVGKIGELAGLIMALSLFQDPEDLKIKTRPQGTSRDYLFFSPVLLAMESDEPITAHIGTLLKLALHLIGHNIREDIDHHRWVMSASNGQVVYPALYESHQLKKDGFLTLSWSPGILQYKGQAFSSVISEKLSIAENDRKSPDDTFLETEDVTLPCNKCAAWEVSWTVSIGDDVLQVSVGLRGSSTKVMSRKFAASVLYSLSSVIFLDSCPHRRNSPLGGVDQYCQYSSPASPRVCKRADRIPVIGVVAVDGADDLRCYTLCGVAEDTHSWPYVAVLRGNACIGCCLDVCRKADSPILVL